MSVQVKRRRDTAAFLSTFAGAAGELLIDTTNNRLQVHDGATKGGWSPLGMSPAAVVEGKDGSNIKHGGMIAFAAEEELLTGLSGPTKVSTIAFPNQCLILGVCCRVTTGITGAASFNVGRTAGTADEFGNVAIGLGTTNSGVLGTPNGNYAATTVTLTAVGGNFTAGDVRIQLSYLLLTPPPS